jgi:hypothetical protein
MTSIFIARYLGESADPILTAVQGFVTIDFLDVACKLLLSPTKYTESPRRKAGSTYTENERFLQNRKQISKISATDYLCGPINIKFNTNTVNHFHVNLNINTTLVNKA